MLSGKAPFQSSSHRDCSAAAIMERIRGGEFNTTGKEFELVSDQAKKLIEGRQTSPKFLVGNIAHKNGRSTATSQHARLQFEIASFRFADR